MYDRITNTSIDVFDGGTGDHLGKARSLILAADLFAFSGGILMCAQINLPI